MSKDKKNVKWKPYHEVRHVQKTMFFSWAFSIFIPIILIVVVNMMIYGASAVEFIFKPDFINSQVFQLEQLNSGEYFRKIVGNFIIDQPNEEEIVAVIDKIVNENELMTPDDRFKKMIVVIRKNEKILSQHVLGDPLSKTELAAFSRLPDDILPGFKSGRETNNETLLHETGYVIASQQDFYFEDGSEGSVFAFYSFTNIPGKIASAIGKSILYVTIFMFFLHMVMAYYMMKRVIKPVRAIVQATEEVSVGNYTYQIPIEEQKYFIGRQPFLGSISVSINDMIVELEKGKKVQEKIESMRSEFLANVSHDMKTPLTSIKIHAQAIKDGIVTTQEKMDRYLDNILNKTNDMDHMLDELKVYNELELGTGNYMMQSINFKHFLEDAVEELQYDVSSENISLNLEIEVEEAILEFDPKKLKRVLNNITFNAVKYAEIRPLKLDFLLKECIIDGQKCIQLYIQDNGIGVADEEYGKLFIQHYRVDPARNQTISGSGLGLSIAQSIIEHHGGKIRAEKSDLGGLAIVISLKNEVS